MLYTRVVVLYMMTSKSGNSHNAPLCVSLSHTHTSKKKKCISHLYERTIYNQLRHIWAVTGEKICSHILNTNRGVKKIMSKMSKSELNGSREQLEGSQGEMAWQYDFTITVLTVCVCECESVQECVCCICQMCCMYQRVRQTERPVSHTGRSAVWSTFMYRFKG